MKESDVKYLAGLFDADGSVHFRKNNGDMIGMNISIAASDAVSPDHKILHWLQETFGGRIQHHATLKNSTVKLWIVGKYSDLERLVPRLLKHLVIKGNSLAGQWQLYQTYRGKHLDALELERILDHSKMLRKGLSGPTKPKNHPTWAWVAGYLDGDGCLINRYYAKSKSHHMRVSATGHVKDRYGLDLLFKAFGGVVYQKKTEPNVLVWSRNLGPKDSQFAIHFLKKFVQHAKIKKHKAELILHNHSQRLSVENPTG